MRREKVFNFIDQPHQLHSLKFTIEMLALLLVSYLTFILKKKVAKINSVLIFLFLSRLPC